MSTTIRWRPLFDCGPSPLCQGSQRIMESMQTLLNMDQISFLSFSGESQKVFCTRRTEFGSNHLFRGPNHRAEIGEIQKRNFAYKWERHSEFKIVLFRESFTKVLFRVTERTCSTFAHLLKILFWIRKNFYCNCITVSNCAIPCSTSKNI